MSNRLSIKTSVEAIQESSETIEGHTYSNYALDGNSGKKVWGGELLISPYGDDGIAYWENAIVSATSFTAINNSDWTTSSDVTDGTDYQIKITSNEDPSTWAISDEFRIIAMESSSKSSTELISLGYNQISLTLFIVVFTLYRKRKSKF